MDLSKEDPVDSIFKLVDACNQSSQLFAVAATSGADTAFNQLALKILQKLDRFGFELRTELRRLGRVDFSPLRTISVPGNLETVAGGCETSLRLAVDQYRKAPVLMLPAHARAMINRQTGEIEQAYEEFVSIRRAA